MASGRYSRKRYMLMEEARKYAVPMMKHTEFKCPCCGGIASAVIEEGVIKAECHVTGTKVYEVKR